MAFIFVNARAPYLDGCPRCGSWRGSSTAPCDLAACRLCGAVQCMSQGTGHGACGVCHVGVLEGWSGSGKACERAGCDRPGACTLRRRRLCRAHADRVTRRGRGRTDGEVQIARLALLAALAGRTDGWKMRAVPAEGSDLAELVRAPPLERDAYSSRPLAEIAAGLPGTLLAEVGPERARAVYETREIARGLLAAHLRRPR